MMKRTIETSAPAREERLHAGIAFGGSCGELRCRLNTGGSCISAPNRAFSETYGCQFTLSLGIINTLRNAVVIMHGPIGCGFCSTASSGTGKSFKRLRDPNSSGTIWISSNLDEKPFFTLEFDEKNLTVVQNRGLRNCDRTPEVESFEKAWLEQVRQIRMKGRVRVA